MLFGIVSIPTSAFLAYTADNLYKKWVKIFLFPLSVILAFIFNLFILSLIYGGGLGLIALSFAKDTSHPLIYLIIAGISAFFISAPSGE